jgi:hypothetical protein
VVGLVRLHHSIRRWGYPAACKSSLANKEPPAKSVVRRAEAWFPAPDHRGGWRGDFGVLGVAGEVRSRTGLGRQANKIL